MNIRRRFCECIVSGGQTGVDRAALDFAIEHGYPHGGYCPAGRRAEDGPIPLRYQLTEMDTNGYRQRTRRNVEESDATLILSVGEPSGGTLATLRFAESLRKPHFLVDLAQVGSSVSQFLNWLQDQGVVRLNVAGPRESKAPGVHALALQYLKAADAAFTAAT